MNSVAKGLSLNSHATKCALMYGIPQAVVSRAEHVRYGYFTACIWSWYRKAFLDELLTPLTPITSKLDTCISASELLSRHELGQLLDEDLTDAEKAELEEAEAVCRAFVAWDLDEDVSGVKDCLSDILGVVE